MRIPIGVMYIKNIALYIGINYIKVNQAQLNNY